MRILHFLIFISLITIILSQIQANFTIEENDYESYPKSKLMKSFLEVPIESEFNAKTLMKLCLGTSPQCFNLIVQTNSFYIMVSDYQSRAQESKNKFDYSKSSSIVRNSHLITLDYYDQTIKGQEASDILTLGDKTLSRINFLILLASGKIRFYDGFIGLRLHPKKRRKKIFNNSAII